MAKYPNALFTSLVLAKKQRFRLKSAIKFTLKSGFLKNLGDFNAIIKRSRPKITLFPSATVMRRANERNERTIEGVLRSPV